MLFRNTEFYIIQISDYYQILQKIVLREAKYPWSKILDNNTDCDTESRIIQNFTEFDMVYIHIYTRL